MSLFKRLPFLFGLAVTTILSPLLAQTVSDEGISDVKLAIPDGQKLFGKNDPNVRRATAVVNGEIITGTDIDHRLALVVSANQGKLPEDEVERFRVQLLANLIDETLQIQAAKENKIEVTDSEVDEYFSRISQQNFNRTPAETEKYIKSIGASTATLKRQIKGELAWSRLLRRNIEPSINVSSEEVNAIMARINATRGTAEFHLGEIYLSFNSENETQVLANAKKILEQLRQGGSFVAYARQFSESSSAAVGGDLGWLKLGQLPQSMADAAGQMGQNEVVAVPTPGGISLLLLIDKRQVATADSRDAQLSLKQIALGFPAGMTEAQATPMVKRFNEETQKINGCGAADKMAQELGAEVVNRDNIRVRDLPGPLQQVMLSLQIGQATPPYGSMADGVRVFVLCGRDAPEAANVESFAEIQRRLEEERVAKRARIYLRDLRRDAIIDYN
jgi:peptidyl-prolyl cis-trans isomerase SurA